MISILIPIYNGIEFIEQSVGSVLTQTFKNWEIIIGINGHEPNSLTYQIANKYTIISDKIKVYDLYSIKGKSQALNEMLKFCNYEWIAILDVDDIWYPEKLEEQVKFLNNFDVIGTKCEYFDEGRGVPSIPIGDISSFNFLEYNPIINSSSIIKKKYCYWNTEPEIVEDYELWLNLRYNYKLRFYNLDKILVKHRIHKTSAFNNDNINWVPKLKEKFKNNI
jgi:teichuronic acid biosynthesis glycosyltransferase TuaG